MDDRLLKRLLYEICYKIELFYDATLQKFYTSDWNHIQAPKKYFLSYIRKLNIMTMNENVLFKV